MNGEIPATIGMPMEGFFDGANVVAKAMASTSAAIQKAPVEALVPPP